MTSTELSRGMNAMGNLPLPSGTANSILIMVKSANGILTVIVFFTILAYILLAISTSALDTCLTFAH